MNVVKRLLYTAAGFLGLTAISVYGFPDYSFVKFVQPMLGLGLLGMAVLTAVSVYREDDLTMHDKSLLMNGFLVFILIPSFYTAGAFVHESQTSWSGGEIHWHADFEVIVEEGGELERLNLIDPKNFCKDTGHESSYMCKINDRTGAKEYHEHNDNRIHLEGTFKEREDASLAAFFETFYGELSNEKMVFPTNDGTVKVTKEDGRSLKILVKRGVAGDRAWCLVGEESVPEEDLCDTEVGPANSPSDYVISPYTQGPNLDDIYVIYDHRTASQALEDVRDDDLYQNFEFLKSGEGY